MKFSLAAITTVLACLTVNGQCPVSVSDDSITECNGMMKSGTWVHIDFHKINKPCNCSVTPQFTGILLVTAEKIYSTCNAITNVGNQFNFNCPMPDGGSSPVKATKGQAVTVRTYYKSIHAGDFFYCIGFLESTNGNYAPRNMIVQCGMGLPIPPTETSTTTTTSSSITSSQKMLSSTKNHDNKASETTVNPTSDSSSNISKDSAITMLPTDENEMLFIIAGSGIGGGLVIIVVTIILLVICARKRKHKDNPLKGEQTSEHRNDAFQYERDLPDNPLYHSNQPVDDVGYSTTEEQQLGLPPSQMNADDKKPIPGLYDTPVEIKTRNDDQDIVHEKPAYDIPKKSKATPTEITSGAVYAQVNKPEKKITQTPDAQDVIPEIPVYAMPKKSKTTSNETTPGAVYAQVNKPQKNKIPIRNQNQDGLVYMEVEHGHATSPQNSPYTDEYNHENVMYAEVETK